MLLSKVLFMQFGFSVQFTPGLASFDIDFLCQIAENEVEKDALVNRLNDLVSIIECVVVGAGSQFFFF